jgi:hypothetical protein
MDDYLPTFKPQDMDDVVWDSVVRQRAEINGMILSLVVVVVLMVLCYFGAFDVQQVVIPGALAVVACYFIYPYFGSRG